MLNSEKPNKIIDFYPNKRVATFNLDCLGTIVRLVVPSYEKDDRETYTTF